MNQIGLDDDDKVRAFRDLMSATNYSRLPFTQRRDLATKWLDELNHECVMNDSKSIRETEIPVTKYANS